jgi:hypothetical protein
MEQLVNLYKANPKKLPLKTVADILGINEEGLKANIQSGKCPFAIGYQLTKQGNRVSVIPTLTFLMWYTQGAIVKYIGGIQDVQSM